MRTKLLILLMLTLIVSPASAKEYIVKMVSDPGAVRAHYFDPSKLNIQVGDTVTFVNVQNKGHDVMFDMVPKKAELAMSPMMKKKGQKWSYTFKVPGSYRFHCHPHEKHGMKGSIIVGKPSKKSEVKFMDHGDMDHKKHGH